MNNNLNNQPKSIFDEENPNIVDESFSMDYADTYQKQMLIGDNNLNETILEQKLKNARNGGNPNENFYLMNQYQNINDWGENDLNITIQDRKKEDYLEKRNFPIFSKDEFLNIKKSVGKDLLKIQDYLLIKLKEYNKFDRNKKIGPLLPLAYLIENHYKFKKENKNQMEEKYNRLKTHIFNYRKIYGDGNCFYRAVMFRYIELLILYRKTDFLKRLIIDIYRSFKSTEIRNRLYVGKDFLNPNLIIQTMITILELVENNRIVDAHLSLYKAILYSKIFDFSLILYLRYIIYDYIKRNENKLYLESFPVLIGNLLPLNYEKDGKFFFKSFYDNNLLKMFTYPEKIIIYLTPFVLGINLKVVLFEDKEMEVEKNLGFNGINELDIDDSIFLLFRNGRFESIFTYEDNQKFNYIYNYYRNDLKQIVLKIDNSLYKNLNKGSAQEVFNKNVNSKPHSIYGSGIFQNIQNSEIQKKNKFKDLSDKNINNNIIKSSLPHYNYNTCYNSNNIAEKFNFDNVNDKSYEAFTYSNGQYSYKNDQNEIQLSKSLNCFNLNDNPNDNQNSQFNHNTSNSQRFPNNNINNYLNQYNTEDNKAKTSIYFYKNPESYRINSILFDKAQNIYSLAQNFNNNMNNNMNYNMNNNNMNNNMNNNCMQNNMNNYMNNNYMNNNMNNNYNINNNYINNNNGFNYYSGNNSNLTLKCNICSSMHSGLKNIKSICPNCFMGEIINQSKIFYINYLKSVTYLERANSITKSEFENLFMKKVIINFENKTYNLFKAIDEYNCPQKNIKFDFNQIFKKLILEIKQQICAYCFGQVQNSEFKFPCGCNFCSYYHLSLYMNEKVQTKITYNYKCFCSFKYKPNKVFELCNLLFNKKIYKDFNFFIGSLNGIFCRICFKCSSEKQGLAFVDIEGFCPNKFNHFICQDCIKKDNSNCVECTICKIQHKYMIKDY